MIAEPILVTTEDGVATVLLNAPERRNALSEHMLVALADALDEVAGDLSVRAVLIGGVGPTLCAGHDLAEIRTAQDATPADQRAYFADLFTRTANLMVRIATLHQPVVVLAHGRTEAAGLQIVASGDLALAAPSTEFRLEDRTTGYFGAAPLAALLPSVPPKVTSAMMYRRTPMTASEAVRFGVVNAIVPEERLLAEGVALAAGLRTPSCTIGKPTIFELSSASLEAAYKAAAAEIADALSRPEARDALDRALAETP
ncbi:MAG: enoyl-CoA hydratase-related protein [Pseudomonadota bacterium]